MGKIYEALERTELESSGQNIGPKQSERTLFDHTSELVVMGRPGSVIAEKFRFLRSRIVRPADNHVRRTILITSALQGEGKTFTSSNLAVTLAQGMDEYVLLVDADLRFPRLHQVFGYESSAYGLAEHLAEGMPLADVLQKSQSLLDIAGGKLTILPAGQPTSNPHELLSSKRMRELIAEVRDRYPDRFVIFDSPPLELAPETLVMAHEVDGTYLVVRKASTPRDTIKAAKERIPNEKFLGVIFNGHEVPKKYYRQRGKGSGSGYGYGYGYGHAD